MATPSGASRRSVEPPGFLFLFRFPAIRSYGVRTRRGSGIRSVLRDVMHHDDTRIYTKSLDLLSLCADVIERMPPDYAFLSDQLRRASSSVTLNFSEGCGRTSKADRARFFMMARGSAKEVAAILDVGHRFRIVRDDQRERGRDLCDHLAAMLYRFH